MTIFKDTEKINGRAQRHRLDRMVDFKKKRIWIGHIQRNRE